MDHPKQCEETPLSSWPFDLFEATASDGTPISYMRTDAPGEARVVLVHSLAMDHGFWRPVVEALAPSVSVIAIDCRGHGRSGKPTGPYSVELFANDVVSVLDHAGWDRSAIAGASMGGGVALAFAGYHPERCSGLGLFDTTAWYGPDSEAQWQVRADKAAGDGLESMVAFQQTRWFGDAFRAANPALVADCVATFLRNDVAAYVAACGMMGACDLRSAMAGVQVPCAILVGEEDYATPPSMAEAMHQGIAGSTLEIIPGARHFTPLEQPGRIASAIAGLSGRVAP